MVNFSYHSKNYSKVFVSIICISMLTYSFTKNYVKGKAFKNITEKYQSLKGCHVNMSDPKIIKDTVYTQKGYCLYMYIQIHLFLEIYGCYSTEVSLDQYFSSQIALKLQKKIYSHKFCTAFKLTYLKSHSLIHSFDLFQIEYTF